MGCCQDKELLKLQKANTDTPYFTLKGETKLAKLVELYDGDTGTFAISIKGEIYLFKCRLYGIDAPELKPRKNIADRENVIKAAKASRDYLLSLFPPDKIVKLEILDKQEKYGRLLVNVRLLDGTNLNEMMVRNHHAVEYFGGKKDAAEEISS